MEHSDAFGKSVILLKTIHKPMTTKRLDSLDTVRGLATLQVLFHHCLITLPLFWALFNHEIGYSNQQALPYVVTNSPLHFLWAGPEGVLLFFVLSGFVLYKSISEQANFNYLSYLCKRLFRLYIPFLAIITIATLLLNYVFLNHPQLNETSSWFNGMWKYKVTTSDFLTYLILGGDFHNLDTTLWSIGAEIKISIIFPFIVLFYKRLNLIQSALTIVIYVVFYRALNKFTPSFIMDHLAFLSYVSLFLLGAFLYKYQDSVTRYLPKSKGGLLFLLIFVLILYTHAWNTEGVSDSYYLLLKKVFNYIGMYLGGLSSFILLLLTLNASNTSFLQNNFLVWLGKISYSLYLVHPIVLILMVYCLINVLPLMIIVLLTPIISILIAYLFHKTIEYPAQYYGKLIAKNLIVSRTLVRESLIK
jgi:peptidoglycan/LPS O-acetylase OafA/YrhL